MREGCVGHEVALPLSEAKRIAEALAQPEAARPAAQQGTRPNTNLLNKFASLQNYRK
ncbi:MAG: hypothetical protein KatS3mg035_1519 [Bacteroidia bacterium]|nr:MAG: hypothetical protein KatS3mg035_1519 [Bacteroidia bacterium]